MNKVIIVTGAGGGIGAQVSKALSREGYVVACADLPESAAAQTAFAIRENGGSAMNVTSDISSKTDCARMVSTVKQHLGQVYGLVNCAGISKPGDSLSYSAADWERMIDIQLNGAFYAAQAVGMQLVADGVSGSLVLITSTNAEAAFPKRAAYCAAKAGVAMLVKVLAIEWAHHGIRVNAIGPAYVETEMTRRNIEAGNVDRAQIERRIPLGRLAQPADVADAASFLLSDKAGFITGHSLYVDGGWLAYGYF